MQHSFDIIIAKEYGVLEAILINHFEFWIAKNAANQKNYYDGQYWTYNSIKSFNQLFPYVTPKQIRNALEHLKELGIIQTGNFNKSSYDRTLWYAFAPEGKWIVQKCKMESAKWANGFDLEGKPIPDINTYINTNINNNKELFDYDWINGEE